MGNSDLPAYGAGASTIAMALLFGSITFATAAMAAKSYISGDHRGESTSNARYIARTQH